VSLSAAASSELSAALVMVVLPLFAMASDPIPSTCRVLWLSVPELADQSVLPAPTDSNPRMRCCPAVSPCDATPSASEERWSPLHAARQTTAVASNNHQRRIQTVNHPFPPTIADSCPEVRPPVKTLPCLPEIG
jgi:hypothetical protein